MLTTDRVMLRLMAGEQARNYRERRAKLLTKLRAIDRTKGSERELRAISVTLYTTKFREAAIELLDVLREHGEAGWRLYFLIDRQFLALDGLRGDKVMRARGLVRAV